MRHASLPSPTRHSLHLADHPQIRCPVPHRNVPYSLTQPVRTAVGRCRGALQGQPFHRLFGAAVQYTQGTAVQCLLEPSGSCTLARNASNASSSKGCSTASLASNASNASWSRGCSLASLASLASNASNASDVSSSRGCSPASNASASTARAITNSTTASFRATAANSSSSISSSPLPGRHTRAELPHQPVLGCPTDVTRCLFGSHRVAHHVRAGAVSTRPLAASPPSHTFLTAARLLATREEPRGDPTGPPAFVFDIDGVLVRGKVWTGARVKISVLEKLCTSHEGGADGREARCGCMAHRHFPMQRAPMRLLPHPPLQQRAPMPLLPHPPIQQMSAHAPAGGYGVSGVAVCGVVSVLLASWRVRCDALCLWTGRTKGAREYMLTALCARCMGAIRIEATVQEQRSDSITYQPA
eukprot:366298-Chlamydomonas_euryale.AAC.11